MNTRTTELYEHTLFENALRAIQKLGTEKFAGLYVHEQATEAEKLAHLLNQKLIETRPSGG